MTINYQKKLAVFGEIVGVEAADGLLEWLGKNPRGKLDLGLCTHLHAANLQVLLAAQPHIVAWPKDANLRAWLEPALKTH